MADKYTIERDLGGGVQMCEAGGEYTLPDYMPEVRRVLRTRCHGAVSGQYASQGRHSVGGECGYQVLYTDEEGKLASTLQEGTFEWETPMEEGAQLFVREGSESVSCRPVGPRRLSLRAGMPLEHFFLQQEEVEEPKVPAEAGEVAVLRHAVQAGRTVLGHSGDLPMSESVRAEPDSKVLSWEGQVLMRELTCESGGMHARGEVWLSALLTDKDGNPYTVRCKAPFEEMLSGGDVGVTMAVGGGNCRGMSCTLSQEEGSDRLTFDFLLDLWGIGVENQTLTPIGDLYALDMPVKCHTRVLEFREYPVARMANFTVDGTPDQHAMEEGATPVDCVGDAFVTSCEAKGNELVVEGEIRASCLLRGEEGYTSHPVTLPYRVRISCGESVPDGTSLWRTIDFSLLAKRF